VFMPEIDWMKVVCTPFTYIKLDNGMTVAYGHHNLDPSLKAGSRVEAGQQIGTSGTANSVPHLHFETWGGKPHQSPLYDPRQVFGWNKNNLPRGGQGARTNPPMAVPQIPDRHHPLLGASGGLPPTPPIHGTAL
jgi:murein DD-endopeptidase MepM/ murein hydrolase activator NlpD